MHAQNGKLWNVDMTTGSVVACQRRCYREYVQRAEGIETKWVRRVLDNEANHFSSGSGALSAVQVRKKKKGNAANVTVRVGILLKKERGERDYYTKRTCVATIRDGRTSHAPQQAKLN